MELVHVHDLLPRGALRERVFLEFQRSADMSSGLYLLPKGGEDHQSPHAEDETYFVLRGRAKVEVAGEVEPVREGSFVFVPARAPHRFLDVEEDLVLLVTFAPAYRSRAAGPS